MTDAEKETARRFAHAIKGATKETLRQCAADGADPLEALRGVREGVTETLGLHPIAAANLVRQCLQEMSGGEMYTEEEMEIIRQKAETHW